MRLTSTKERNVQSFGLLLSHPAISRIRRNHALEHATIHLLAARFPQRPIVGRSDTGGFTLFADLPTEAIEEAAAEALARLRDGDRRMALHPNCGTNLLTTGVLTGSAAFLGLAERGETSAGTTGCYVCQPPFCWLRWRRPSPNHWGCCSSSGSLRRPIPDRWRSCPSAG